MLTLSFCKEYFSIQEDACQLYPSPSWREQEVELGPWGEQEVYPAPWRVLSLLRKDGEYKLGFFAATTK